MYICRLFERDRPDREVDARMIAAGTVTVGRDPAADWPLPDPNGTLSRLHCTLSIEAGWLMLRDTSTNGTFLGDGARAPRDVPVRIDVGEQVQLGSLAILIDEAAVASIDGDFSRTTAHVPLSMVAQPVPRDWQEGAVTAPPLPAGSRRDASLIEAFCEGANLDASALSGEDPAELMRRAGAMYQQTLLGLSALMAERTRMKDEHQLDRTTIRAAANNPFKWTASRKLAQDLLCGGHAGFLSDAAAVRASFEDLSAHLVAVAEGARAAVSVAAETLDPQSIEAEARTQGLSLRGRAATCWDILTRRYAALVAPQADGASAISRAFGEAYARSGD
jgi:predicted component of type VI protein secretion system